ncbi:hypothetical protein D8682_09430 [Buttiauxella sp. 3AFRM03]|uniref:BrnA antitoxin family protein n=1 Tax=Buttiauxella sp. 3AFRM03 TaxID=2479367 RepID=UPI000EF7AEC3|nr:BrnA antitoxin family protein [Buttiauxella sp. 3AFRM03]AYN27177.1 hypothetical protein D8682_09430 [Buttiauxella sp. 3AFRM03]
MSKLKLKSGTILTIPDEDAAITAAIPSDPVTFLLEGENVKLIPLSQFLASRQNKRRPAKIAITIRYSHEVLQAFKSTGEGWQVRMDTALKDWLKNNNPNDVKI